MYKFFYGLALALMATGFGGAVLAPEAASTLLLMGSGSAGIGIFLQNRRPMATSTQKRQH